MNKKLIIIISGVFFFSFMIVAFMTSGTQGILIDETVAYWADQNSIPFMKYASFIGSSEMILLMTIIVGLVLLIKRNWKQLFFFFTVSIGGVVLNFALKMLIHRARPGDEVSYIEVFNQNLEIQSYSFPSGHTMRATILFLFLIYLSYRFGKNIILKFITLIVLVTLIFTVALSRIVLDAHFATDISSAILISISWFFLCLYFFYTPKHTSYQMFSHR